MSANTPEELQAVAAKAMAAPREVLTLRLGGEGYGIDTLGEGGLERRLILQDIEELMTGSEMTLVAQTLRKRP